MFSNCAGTHKKHDIMTMFLNPPRRWTIGQLEKHKGQNEFVHCCLRSELAISLQAAESYADNYTAWSHRSWLVERFMKDMKKVSFLV